MLVALLLATAGCTGGGAPVTQQPSRAATPCVSKVVQKELPEWARAGFSPGTEPHHVFSGRGDMVAVLFGYPLFSPPRPNRGNKILWVSRLPLVPSKPLRIEARLEGGGAPVRTKVSGGPGPSLIDLPSPGCWRLSLSWSSHTDSIDLEYVAPD
ncbi:hypothetical protein FXF51_58470 [Nonomuraea sp. PA05]|uniref:hypothetical protein n=1 Tax=Nonomuraea sp. PA05 TaxID=2604466 RepID=UPI0011DB4F3A|nr:hypothetical protein [Nonomuraea sp. PA05]TYB47342.1 hypothetical protein FXF51_58470 [Nonomuraea sp. PA05]